MVCFCSSVRPIASSSELGTVGHAPSSLVSLNQGVGALFGRAVTAFKSLRGGGIGKAYRQRNTQENPDQ